MLKIKIFSTFCVLLGTISNVVLSQNNSVIVAQWEHQTDTHIAYPDYFQDQAFTDSLKLQISDWLRENYAASTTDFKKRNPVSFVVVISPPSEPRSIEHTVYDLSLGIVSTLESGLTYDRYKPEEGLLKFDVWLLDRKGRKIFKNKTAVRFVIARKPSNPNEVYLSREDFYELYKAGIRAALNIQPTKKMHVFQQPDHEVYNQLISQSEPLGFYRVNRGVFEIRGAENPLSFRLDLEVPLVRRDTFSRTAEFINPFNQETYWMEASLISNQAHRMRAKINTNSEMVALEGFRTSEQFVLEANVKGNAWQMSRNLFSNLIKIQKYGSVLALLIYEGGDPSYDAHYGLYFSSRCTTLDKVTALNLIGMEALVQTVQKFYEAETRHK
ncbi:MAG: hypothetical protein NW226_07830 [Microscillaceae bacterium]|nr:hypothetical protein [Microscillaceae bacterium]